MVWVYIQKAERPERVCAMSVSPIGFDVGETHEALIRLRKAGFTPADLNRIKDSDELAKQIVDLLRGGSYPIEVDYSLTLEQMIAEGEYDWVNSDITSTRFPIVGTGKVGLEGQLEHYGRNMSSDAVLADLDQKGLRPATIAEILAFGAKYPELQRQFPIVALGSVASVSGDRDVAYLCRHDRHRSLRLCCFGDVWDAGSRFLVFRK